MPSGNGARIHLSLLLTALMLMPTVLALASFAHEPKEMGTESSPSRSSDKNLGAYLGQLGVPQTDDVSHGWNVEGNIGKAALYHRTAAYVPIQDWTAKTGVMQWNVPMLYTALPASITPQPTALAH